MVLSRSADRARAHAFALTHGWNATAFQTLGDGFSYRFYDHGYVAYVDTGSAWVVAGAPVCSPEMLPATVRAFATAARLGRRRCCFFGVEQRLLEAVRGELDSVPIGEQPVWDPARWEDSLQRHRTLREQLRRARAKGVRVREATAEDSSLLARQLPGLVERWLATRKLPPLGFLVALPATFETATGARFLALRNGRLIAFATLVPVPGRNGWFVEHLMRDPQAPNGSVELLVDGILRSAAAAGCTWLTLGLTPLSGAVPPALRLAQRRLRWLYDFEGLRRFKLRLRPCEWDPIFLAFPSSQNAVVTTFDAVRAFAPGGILRFGLRYMFRDARFLQASGRVRSRPLHRVG